MGTGSATDLAGNSSVTSRTPNIDLTPPEAKNVFNPETPEVEVFGLDALSGTSTDPVAPDLCQPVRWGGDDDGDDKGNGRPNAERCVYTIADAGGNALVLVEKIKRHEDGDEDDDDGAQTEVRVVSLQYNQGAVVDVPPKADKKFEWALNPDGTLKQLQQKIEIGRGRDRRQATAHYSAKKGTTRVDTHMGGGDDDEKDADKAVTGAGLVLLGIVTGDGNLSIAVPDFEIVPKGSDKSEKSDEKDAAEKGSKKVTKSSKPKKSGKG